MLYEVKWDTGQHTKHYYKELFYIGPFQTLEDFEQAIQTTGKDAKLVLGPQGGLREFTMSFQHQGKQYVLNLHKEQGRIWTYLQPILERNSIQIAVEKLVPTPRTSR